MPGETTALIALMEGDPERARKICAAMSRKERFDLAQHVADLDRILDDLNATRCKHDGMRIARGPQSGMVWWHVDTGSSHCLKGGTVAEPVTEES